MVECGVVCIEYLPHIRPCGQLGGYPDTDLCSCGCDAYGDWCVEQVLQGLLAAFGFEWDQRIGWPLGQHRTPSDTTGATDSLVRRGSYE